MKMLRRFLAHYLETDRTDAEGEDFDASTLSRRRMYTVGRLAKKHGLFAVHAALLRRIGLLSPGGPHEGRVPAVFRGRPRAARENLRIPAGRNRA